MECRCAPRAPAVARLAVALLLVALLLPHLAGSAPAAVESVIGAPLGPLALTEPGGAPWRAESLGPCRALVLVFLGTTCPAANRDLPVLAALHARYGPKGVRFLGVNANVEDSDAAVARHAQEFGVPFPVLRDGTQALARRLAVQVTPEAFLADSAGIVRYRGRVGNAEGGELAAALEALMAGRPILRPVTPTAGCAIALRAETRPGAATGLTYHRDIAPILQRRCQSCHRPGQIGPFPLLAYPEVRARAAAIRQAVVRRSMPPWLAEPGHGEFLDPRRLTDEEVARLVAWADAGAPEGDPRDAPPAREWPDGWSLGPPDLCLAAPEPYRVGPSGDDAFRVFVLPTRFDVERQIVGIEFRPGNPRVVHHIALLMDTTGRARELDARDPGPGYDSGPGGVLVPSAELLALWTPGSTSRFLPAGVGRPLPPGADLLLQVHYHRNGREEMDRSAVGLHFARQPTTRVARTLLFGARSEGGIPPGNPRFVVRRSETLPVELRLLSVTPHMHLLGKEMRATAILPDGTRRDLVWVRSWDYRWQEAYRYREPLRLPEGTRLELVACYDNSEANPLNPNRPPKRVQFGERASDEMATLILEGIVEDMGDSLQTASGGAGRSVSP